MRDPARPGLLHRMGPVHSAVVVRPGRLGDLLCAGPAIELLAHVLPGAAITLMTVPIARELAERLPGVDRVVDFPGWPGIAEQLFDARAALVAVDALQREHVDLAVQLYGSGVHANPFTLLLGARATAGFVRPGDPAGLLDAALPLPSTGHEIDRALALPRFLHGDATEGVDAVPRLCLRPEDRTRAAGVLAGASHPLVGFHTGARDRNRRWPTEHAAGVAGLLANRLGATIVSLGDDNTGALDLPRRAASVLDLRGRVRLGTLAGTVERLDVLVTTDSGPAHLAYALGTPSVTVVGPSDPARHGPRAGPHAVVRARYGPEGVEPDAGRVLAAALSVVRRGTG